MHWNELLRSKTFWTGVTGILSAIAGGLTGTLPVAEAVQLGIGSLAAIFLRDKMALGK